MKGYVTVYAASRLIRCRLDSEGDSHKEAYIPVHSVFEIIRRSP